MKIQSHHKILSRTMATLATKLRASIGAGAARNLPTRRSFATSASISGKPRFYRNVSVIPSLPPWSPAESPSSSSTIKNEGQQEVASPISAGVDGTDSASGVVAAHNRLSNRKPLNYYRDWLTPRTPGVRCQPTSSAPQQEFDWYAVCLDGRPLQTPSKSRLVVPSKFLAQMIAAEWNAQSPTLRPAQMPLTTLSCTILDQVSEQPSVYQSSVLQYLPTDTLLFWADATIDQELYREQQNRWTPILEFAQGQLGHRFPVTCADANVVVNTRKSQIPTVDAGLQRDCQEWVEGLDAWHLGVLYALTVEAKSMLMGLAYLYETPSNPQPVLEWKRLTNFVPSCRVEEEVQISRWGVVEGGHDYDRLNCSIQIHAAVLLKQCLDFERLQKESSSV